MILRTFVKEDSAVICSWITTEKELYQWSADRLCYFPLPADALYEYYQKMGDGVIPLTAIDEKEKAVGHIFIRYPQPEDKNIVRLGFVIVDKALRGQGVGKQLVQAAIDYVHNQLHAKKITLGVFVNNESAQCCYEAVGFRPTGETVSYQMQIGDWNCMEMEL